MEGSAGAQTRCGFLPPRPARLPTVNHARRTQVLNKTRDGSMRLAHKFADEPEEPKPGSATAALVAPLQLAGLRSPVKQDATEGRLSDPETRKPANDPN